MLVGVPKEIKNHEYRAGLIPASVRELTSRGHNVIVETQVGAGIGFTDQDYIQAGATIAKEAKEVFAKSDLIVKVKEPSPEECAMLRKGQTLFTYLHLAPDPVQAKGLIESGCSAIAYETVTDDHGGLPLLAPMSEVAGRMSIQVGANLLQKANGGSGVLLGGVTGVSAAKVTIIGGGVVGLSAARMAVGLGARVVILDRNPHRLHQLDTIFNSRVQTIFSNVQSIEDHVKSADLVIGGVLIAGKAAPKLVSHDLIKKMRPGSVMVDVAIDQGGCFETSKPTSHQDPTYVVDGVVHYCVTNMPGAVPRTSAIALNNATIPYVLALANQGTAVALLKDKNLRHGLNVHAGLITHEQVANDLGHPYHKADAIFSAAQ